MEAWKDGRPIEQIDEASGAVIREYQSGSACAAALGIPVTEVAAVVSGKVETSQGYKLRFKPSATHPASQEPAASSAAVAEDGEGRKRKRNTKYTNYAKTQIEGGSDSDLDLDVLKDSDSDGDSAPRRKYKPRAKTNDLSDRAYGSRANVDVYAAHLNAQSRGLVAPGRQWSGPSSLSPLSGTTVRMEPGNDAYTLTDGVPNWVDYDVQYEECGSRVLEAVLARRKVDRSQPSNGITDKKGPLPTISPSKTVGLSIPAARAAAAAAASDDEDEEDEEVVYEDDVVDVFKEHYEYEYQCKFKGRSYRHLEWLSAEELETLAFRAKQQFHRYLKKIQLSKDEGEGDDGLEPYGEVWDVERILAKRVVETEVPDESKRPPPEDETPSPTPANTSSPSSSSSASAGGAVEESEVATVELKLLPSRTRTPLFCVGDFVTVARHDREGKSSKTQFGGVGFVTSVDVVHIGGVQGGEDDEEELQLKKPGSSVDSSELTVVGTGPVRFTYNVRYVVGSGNITEVAEEVLSPVNEDGTKDDRKARKAKTRAGDDELNKTLTPLDRCAFLLERFQSDPLCEPFLEPVDLAMFPDYDDHVNNPMDLGTVRQKIEDKSNKGYREEVQFARDMRSVWTNCKRYNHRDSAIWQTADFCQKTFERLFQAWVLVFIPPDRAEMLAEMKAKAARRGRPVGDTSSLSLFNYKRCKNKNRRHAAARPWEQSCRVCEDPSETSDPTLLCDHCDAQYHLGCLTPKVKKLPEHSWWCPVCANEPVKMHSAAIEEVASARIDTMGLPKKTVLVTEYLVKWLARSYGDCSWETAEDINDDSIVSTFEHGEVVAEDEVGFDRMAREFRDGFVKTVGGRAFPEPFVAPTLRPAPRIPHEHLTDIVPMPVTEPNWVCRTDRPEPMAGVMWHLLHQFRPPGSETPMHNVAAQAYAQIKLFHYLNHSPPIALGVQDLQLVGEDEDDAATEEREFRGTIPAPLLLAAGPSTAAMAMLQSRGATSSPDAPTSSSTSSSSPSPPSTSFPPEDEEVALCLAELVEHVVRRTRPLAPGPHPLRVGEYDVVIPKLSTGFHLNIFEEGGGVKVATLRPLPDGTFCPAAVAGVGLGDTLSRINGDSVSHLTFSQVCTILGGLETGAFVYLRFLRAEIEPELRPEMIIEHRGHPDFTVPGEPSSKFRGVFKRGEEWEVAVCLHPNPVHLNLMAQQNLPLPKSLYLVVGVTQDEQQGAMAYDHHAQAMATEIRAVPWAHLDNRVMISFELQMYTPHKAFVLNYGSLGYYSRIDEPPQGAAAEEASVKSKQKKKKSSKGGGHGEDDDSDDYVEGGEDSESSSSDSDSDDEDDPVDLEISTGPAASEESEDEDEDGEKKSASISAAPRSSSHASEPSSATPLSPLSSEPSSAKMEDDAAAAEADEEDDEDGEDEDEDEDDDDDDDDDDVGSGGGRSRPRKQTKDKKKKKGSSSLASSSLSSSVSAESEAKAAKAALRAKEKRAKRLVVLESEWLAAGHMERLLLAVERCPHKPQSDAWADTGLEPPRDLEKEAAQAAEAVAASSSVMDGEASTSNKELASGQSVAQYDLDTGKVLKVWPSGNTAAKSMGVPLAMLRDACISGVEVAGYRWEPFVSAAEETEGSSSSSSSSSGGGSSGAGGSPEKRTKKKERDDGVFQYSDSLTYKGDNKLRDYQLNGLNWLLLCHHYKRSCILADEMGLGKTVQVVSFLEHLCTVDKLRGPFLVVVPLSTVGHWEREFASWTDLNVCMYHDGGRDMRALIRAFEWYQDGRAPQFGSSSRLKFQVLITTYDEVIKDVDQLGAVPWRGLIVDEAHRLKGVTSKLLESLNQILPLGVQQHGTQHRLLMTGTPLQNNTKELWSLLNFIEPSKFTSLENFQETYEEMDSEYQVRSLQQRLAPHLLRRVKEDVATDIPAKFETVIDVELTTIQKQYYRAIFEKNQAFLARAARGAVVPKLMNIQMELRKCCNHPYLIEGVESREAELLQEELVNEAAAAASGSSGASRAAAAGGDNSLTLPASIIPEAQFKRAWLERCLLRSSGKMVLLDKLLPKLKREGHKVLIFSQMTRILNILEDFCEYRNFNVERLDGSIVGSKRQQAIDRFNNNEDAFVFLLSTRAGGVGINLCAADTCIIFDSDWNPQNDVQAQARCHRIGQTKEVMVYRLITRKSFESEMFERASLKLGLERAVLGTRDFDGGGDEAEGADGGGGGGGGGAGEGSTTGASGEVKLSQGEMEKLLRQGAYAMAEDDTEANAFCEGDIDSILNERSRVRKIEAGRTAGWLNKKSKLEGLQNKVTKTSFTSSSATANADVSVDDPNFWAKVMPNMKNAAMLKDQLTALAAVEKPDPAEIKTLVKEIQEVAAEAMERAAKGSTKLSEVERRDLQDLLLRVSCSGELVGEEARADAEATREALEGKRRRTHTHGGAKSHAPKSRAKRGSSKGSAAAAKRSSEKGGGGEDYEDDGVEEEEEDIDDVDEDEDDEEDLLDEDEGGGEKGKGRGRWPNGASSAKKATPGKRAKSLPKEKKEKAPKPPKPPKPVKPPPKVKTPKAKKSSATAAAPTPFEGVDLPDLGSSGNGGGGAAAAADGGSGGGKRRSKSKKEIDNGDVDIDEGAGMNDDDLLPPNNKGAIKKRSRTPDSGGSSNTSNSIGKVKTEEGGGADEEEVQSPPFAIPARKSCAEWPSWPEPASTEELQRICVGTLEVLFEDEDVEDVFGYPVPEDTPLYSTIIPESMDLGTMHDKASAGEYSTLAQFRYDLRLVIDNCLTFNMDGSEFFKMAQDLAGVCHESYLKAVSG